MKFHVFQPISGMVQCRSSRPEVFCKKSTSKNLAKFTGKHLCWPEACNFIKKETLSQVFSREFCEIFKNIFFKKHLWTTASEHWSDMGKVSWFHYRWNLTNALLLNCLQVEIYQFVCYFKFIFTMMNSSTKKVFLVKISWTSMHYAAFP